MKVSYGFLSRLGSLRNQDIIEVTGEDISCQYRNHCKTTREYMEMTQRQVVPDSKPLTTFVQADTDTFKDVVQRLTGSSEAMADSGHELTIGKGNIGVKRPEFKLHERRQYKAKLEIIKPPLNIKHGAAIVQQYFQEQQLQSPEQRGFSPCVSGNRFHQTSPLNTPTKCFSGLSLVERESEGESKIRDLNTEEEEKAIKERRFYLHPSPRSNPGYIEPELLSLFPLTSPGKGRQT